MPLNGHLTHIAAGYSDEMTPPVGQCRHLGGFETDFGEDAVNRALANLEGSGNPDPGRPSAASAITCAALARACGGCPLYLPSALARAIPSRWRSSMLSRTSWSMAAMTVRIMRLIAPAMLPLA